MNLKRITFIPMLLVLLGTIGPACFGEEKPAPSASAAAVAAFVNSLDRPALQQRNPRYIVQKGDALDISFTFTPEYNRTVTVQPDGYVNLSGIPDVRLEGKTTPEIVELLKAAYAKILHDPAITVELKDFEKPYFIAGGQLGKPGKFDMRGETTLTQAVAIAGGFTEKSKHSQVLLFRRASNAWVEAKQFDLKKMLRDGNLTEDPLLHPGDMIFVPQNALSKIAPYIPRVNLGIYASQW
jgi:polysaccharide export outer membrane protein